MKKLFFIIFLLSILLLSGCGEPPECNANYDCSSKSCATAMCVDNTCKYDYKDNCCGNNIKEDIEDGLVGSQCTCPADYGACAITNGTYNVQYFEAGCDENDVCAIDVKENSLEQKFISKEVAVSRYFTMLMKTNYDDPFNIKKSIFDIEFELTALGEEISEPKITKIQIKATKGRDEITLAEVDINKKLFIIGSKINEKIYLNYNPKLSEESLTGIKAIINYEYTKKTSSAITTETGDTSVDLKSRREALIFLAPTRKYECGLNECDDDNPGTIDSCIEGTPFCLHKRRPGACGNFVCDARENKCTCPTDCGPCSGNVGEFLSFSCSSQNKCITQLKESSQLASFTKPMTNTYFTASIYVNTNKPFDVNNDLVNLKVQLTDTTEKYSAPITIEKIDITGDGTELLGTKVFTSSNAISNVYDEVSFDVPIDFIMDCEEIEKSLSYTIYYSYYYLVNGPDGSMQPTQDRKTFSATTDKIPFVRLG